MHLVFLLPFLLSITSTLVVKPHPAAEHKDTTWDPWAPCTEDWDCPESLMCNIYQHRCTECMENEDCPPCLEEDCPMHARGWGLCVWGPLLLSSVLLRTIPTMKTVQNFACLYLISDEYRII